MKIPTKAPINLQISARNTPIREETPQKLKLEPPVESVKGQTTSTGKRNTRNQQLDLPENE